MNRVLCAVFLVLLFGVTSSAQQSLEIHGGIGAQLGFSTGTMQSIPGIPTPSPLTFESSDVSIQPLFQAGADFRWTSLLRAGALIGVSSYQFVYGATENVPIATDDGDIYQATLGHDLQLSFTTLWLEPYVRIEPLPWLGVLVGLPLSVTTSSDYIQTQQFIDPPGLNFVDGSLQQVTGTGVVPGMSSVVPGLTVQADGMFPILADRTLLLNPFVGFSAQLGSWNSGTSMYTVSVNVGLGLRYRFFEPEPVPELHRDTTMIRDTVVILSSRVTSESTELMTSNAEELKRGDTVAVTIRQRYQRVMPKPPAVLQAALRLAFESEVGGITKEARLIVTKVRRTRVVPFLPIVVFDGSETVIPERYQRISSTGVQRWTDRDAVTDPDHHWQYHVMNIVGDRLRKNVTSSMQLIAYDDGTTEGTRIATERASAVRRYLTSTFNIDERRIGTDIRHGQASQQPWIFLADDTRMLLKPITATDTVNETRLPRVRLQPDVVSEAGLRSWSVTMTNNGLVSKSFEGTGAVPATLIWDMSENISPDEAFGSSVTAKLTVVDNEGTHAQSEPGRINPKGPATSDQSRVTLNRTRTLRWIGADYLHTPDLELFGTSPIFDRVDVYPSTSRREDFFVVNVPAVVHPVNAEAWFRKGLMPPERELYDHAEVYTKEERVP